MTSRHPPYSRVIRAHHSTSTEGVAAPGDPRTPSGQVSLRTPVCDLRGTPGARGHGEGEARTCPSRQPDLFARACDAATEATDAGREHQAVELAGVEAELRKAERAIERYMLAFNSREARSQHVRPASRGTDARAVDLRERHTHLADELAMAAAVVALSASELRDLRSRIVAAVEAGTDGMRKAMVQGLVEELRVVEPNRVPPTLRYEDRNVVRTRSSLLVARNASTTRAAGDTNGIPRVGGMPPPIGGGIA